MATTLKQIQTQKQKLAPRQVLRARLLQLNTVSLEQAILEELEQNPLLEQVEPEEAEPEEEKEETRQGRQRGRQREETPARNRRRG